MNGDLEAPIRIVGDYSGRIDIFNYAREDITIEGSLVGSGGYLRAGRGVTDGKTVFVVDDVQDNADLILGSTGYESLDVGAALLIGGVVEDGATVTLGGDMSGFFSVSEIEGDAFVTVTDSVTSTGLITMGTLGDSSTNAPLVIDDELAGQVIINDEGGSGLHTLYWAGDIQIESVPYLIGQDESQPDEAPFYRREGSDFGGGAIGVAPFNFHPFESNPNHKATVTGSVSQVELMYYGPIVDSNGGNSVPPIKIEATSQSLPICVGGNVGNGCAPASTCTSTIWTDVTANYDVAIGTGANARRVLVTPKSGFSFGPGQYYRILPRNDTDSLVCDLVSGNPAVVDHEGEVDDAIHPTCQEEYWFKVNFGLGGFDLNSNEMLDAGDVSTWSAQPTDVNNDYEVDTNDFIDLVEAVSGS